MKEKKETIKHTYQQNTKETDNSIPIENIGNPGKEESKPLDALELKENELKTALEKISLLEKQHSELKDMLLRKAAEFENYKRRVENDQLNLINYAGEPILRNILQVYDDLERSLTHINDENSFESTKKGLQLVFEKFGKILSDQGIKKIEAKGEQFDVNLHEALMQRPDKDCAPHTVVEVIEPGYYYKDKVIRHAKVVVSVEPISNDENNDSNKI
jgi:molecular chaperone GrpE